MRRALSSTLLSLCLVSTAFAEEKIHPYTKQNWDEWQQRLQAAEDAVAKKAPADEMVKLLEATESFYAERKQPLERHPDYAKGLERQLAARLSLVKLYANMGYLYAKTAIEKKSGTPLTQPGGAFARIEQAAATLKAYGDAKGPGDASFQKMQAYVTDIKRQVDEAGAHLNSTGVAVAPTSTSAVDKATENYFKKWWELLDVAQKAVAAGEGSQAVAAAVRHHDNWKGWLSKHSAYAQALARQQELVAHIEADGIEASIKAARAMSQKGFDEKNGNFFGLHSGVYQKLGEAKNALATLEKQKGASDPEAQKLRHALEEAEKQVAAQGASLEAAQIAERQMPVDVYAGGDKADLKAKILAYWKQKYPADKVLGVRFFEESWTRETNWKENATSIYKTDYSWLPAKVVVETGGEVASLYPAFANKQQSGGKLTISDDRSGSSYGVGKMLMKNVKF